MDILHPEGTDANCFGGALTAALDVMTFTYDVDPNAANQPKEVDLLAAPPQVL